MYVNVFTISLIIAITSKDLQTVSNFHFFVEKYMQTTNNIETAIKIKCFVPNNEYTKAPLNKFTKFYHIILKVAKD